MGGTKSKSVIPKPRPSIMPNIYYLSRFEKFALMIGQKKTEKLRFTNELDLFLDSAICEIEDFIIIIAGGSDQYGVLQSKSYKIDLSTMKIEEISPLPLPSKFGSLLLFKNHVYYVGGITEDQQLLNEYVSTPIMRYCCKIAKLIKVIHFFF